MFWVRTLLHTVNDTLLMKWTLTRTLYLSIFRWALGTCLDYYYCRHKCAHQHNRRSNTRRITTLYSGRIFILSIIVKRLFIHTFFRVFESYSNLLSIISVLWFAHTISLIIWFAIQFGTHIILWFFIAIRAIERNEYLVDTRCKQWFVFCGETHFGSNGKKNKLQNICTLNLLIMNSS